MGYGTSVFDDRGNHFSVWNKASENLATVDQLRCDALSNLLASFPLLLPGYKINPMLHLLIAYTGKYSRLFFKMFRQ